MSTIFLLIQLKSVLIFCQIIWSLLTFSILLSFFMIVEISLNCFWCSLKVFMTTRSKLNSSNDEKSCIELYSRWLNVFFSLKNVSALLNFLFSFKDEDLFSSKDMFSFERIIVEAEDFLWIEEEICCFWLEREFCYFRECFKF